MVHIASKNLVSQKGNSLILCYVEFEIPVART